MNYIKILFIILCIVILLYIYYRYLKTEHFENIKSKIPNYNLLSNGFPSNNAFQLHSRNNNNVIHLSTNNNNFYLKPIEKSFDNYNYVFAFYDKYLYSITDGLFIDIIQPKDASIPETFVLSNNIPKNSNVIWKFVDGNLMFKFKKQNIDELSKKYLPKTWTQPKTYYIHFDPNNQNMFVDNNKNNNEFFLNVFKKKLSDENNLLLEKIIYNDINQKYTWNISKVPVDKRKNLSIQYDILFPQKFSDKINIHKITDNNPKFEFFSSVNCIFYLQIYYLKDKPLTINKKSSSSQTKTKTNDINNYDSKSFNIEYHKQYPELVKSIASDFGVYDPKKKLYYKCNDIIKKIKKPSFSIQYSQVPIPKYIPPSQQQQQQIINTPPQYPYNNNIQNDIKFIRNKLNNNDKINNNLTKHIDKKILSIEQKIMKKINSKSQQQQQQQQIKEKPIIIKLENKRNNIKPKSSKPQKEKLKKYKTTTTTTTKKPNDNDNVVKKSNNKNNNSSFLF